MKLYELLKMSESDYDVYDTEYDASVTVCFIEEDNKMDDYDKFCVGITKKVEVVKIVQDSHLVADWSTLIRDNMEKFKEFTEKNWKYKYRDDEDEFMYQWINEIHLYMAGYVPDSFYSELVEFVESLET